jgi:hypothetical protein
VAQRYGVPTDAWTGRAGIVATLRAMVDALLACTGYVTLGGALGVLLRTTVPAVAIGFGWLFIVESIVPQASTAAYRWLPGQLLGAVAAHGTAAVSLGGALTTLTAYLAVAVAAATVSFLRRDFVV